MKNILIFTAYIFPEDINRIKPSNEVNITCAGYTTCVAKYSKEQLKKTLNAYDLVIFCPCGLGLAGFIDQYLEIADDRSFKSALWSFDSHFFHSEEKKVAGKFDEVFVAHKDFAPLVSEKAHWLPCAYFWHAIGKMPALYEYPKLYDTVGLMRSYPGFQRDKLKATMASEFVCRKISYILGETDPSAYFPTIALGRTAINCAMNSDLSIRFFEVMAMNVPLVQQSVTDISDSRFSGYSDSYRLFQNDPNDTALTAARIADAVIAEARRDHAMNTRTVVEGQDMIIHRYVEIINKTLSLELKVQ